MDASTLTGGLRPEHGDEGNGTLPAILLRNARLRPRAPSCRQKRLGIWKTWTWAQVAREVLSLAIGLEAEGVRAGDAVAVIGAPSPELAWAILAAQTLGALAVPIAPDASDIELTYILEGVRPAVTIARGQDEVERLLGLDAEPDIITRVVYLYTRGLQVYADPRLVSCERLKARGERAPISDLAVRIGWLQPDQPAAIFHTAAARGAPKALEFSHAALLAAARSAAALYGLGGREEVLAALPDASAPAFLFGPVLSLLAGFPLSYPESGETVLTDLREIGPTFLFGPPVLYKRLHTTIYSRMAPAGPRRRRVYENALAALREGVASAAAGSRRGVAVRLRAGFARSLIAGPIMDILGLSRVRTALVFADRLPEAIGLDLTALGLPLHTVYSPSEGAGFVAAERRQWPAGGFDSVGKPVAGSEIRIGTNGEIQFRGPATCATCAGGGSRPTSDWIGTGDAGRLDPDGTLRFLGRLADELPLPGGYRIDAGAIEVLLRGYPQIRDAVVVASDWAGDFAVLISLDAEAITAWAEQQRLGHGGLAELTASSAVRTLVESCVARVNETLAALPGQPWICHIAVVTGPLSVAEGELTRDRKVRRHAVMNRWRHAFTTLQRGGHPPPRPDATVEALGPIAFPQTALVRSAGAGAALRSASGLGCA